MILLALRARSARPLATLALLWPLVALLPSHSVIARLDPIVEKPLYTAWIGPSLALGALAGAALRSPLRARAAAALVCLVLLVAGASWRASLWADPYALWSEATRRAPNSSRAWVNRAVAALQAGDVDGAARWIAQARAIDPHAPNINKAAFALRLMTARRVEDRPR